MGYNTLSPRVPGIFTQYRRNVSNVHRRTNVYRALAGLLTYEAYPSGDDEDWGLLNLTNRPTADVGVDDLFEDKP
ncbi:Hypp6608 [Branchiostoma lanceolatum]|uniref:Hypp6608 protein n=1 Tax=Branchiostoma lanceolatum TaxID=7740 RepID=A0A8J9YV82_BRALA|nr:Hypp6608 [Branchiostoma lanceolatum]